MIKSYTDHKGKSRMGEIELFLELAIDCYQKIKRYEAEDAELQSDKLNYIVQNTGQKVELTNFDHFDRLFLIQNESFKNQITGILSLATFYEALINEIGITELGSSYFKRNLDSLAIIAKWEIVLKLVYGQSISTDKNYYQSMTEIVQSRNKLAHYKTKEAPFSMHDINFDKVLIKGINSLPELMKDLKRLDNEKEILWPYEIDKQLTRLTE